MQYTSRLTIGGRAWTSIKLSSAKQEKALVAWANTSMGLLLHWYHSNKQQAGRGNVVPTSLEALPVLNVNVLEDKQLNAASTLFDDMNGETLLPINQIATDVNRKKLDERFASEVLGLSATFLSADGSLELLRQKLGSEPSIRGSKEAPGQNEAPPPLVKHALTKAVQSP
jgi:hypothetical protein